VPISTPAPAPSAPRVAEELLKPLLGEKCPNPPPSERKGDTKGSENLILNPGVKNSWEKLPTPLPLRLGATITGSSRCKETKSRFNTR